MRFEKFGWNTIQRTGARLEALNYITKSLELLGDTEVVAVSCSKGEAGLDVFLWEVTKLSLIWKMQHYSDYYVLTEKCRTVCQNFIVRVKCVFIGCKVNLYLVFSPSMFSFLAGSFCRP